MIRTNPREHAQQEALRAELRTVRLGRRLDLDEVSGAIRGLLGGDIGMIYAPRPAGERVEVDFLHCSGAPRERLAQGLAALLRAKHQGDEAGEAPVFGYDPLRPVARQRNRAVTLDAIQRQEAFSRDRFTRLCHDEAGVPDIDQVRVLVCEGSTLLAWVGCFRPTLNPFTHREARLLQSLAEALAERFAFEAQLRRKNLAEAALDSALAHFDGPAMVVDDRGTPVFANRDAEALLNREGRDTRQRVSEALAGSDTHYRSFTVGGAGLPRHHLLLARGSDGDAGARVANAARAWGLTPREREVLAQVVRGLTNAAIGRELGCAERTVELHMTHVMAKAGAESRAALIAHFWGLH